MGSGIPLPSFLLIPRYEVGWLSLPGDSVELPDFTGSRVSVVDETGEGWAKRLVVSALLPESDSGYSGHIY